VDIKTAPPIEDVVTVTDIATHAKRYKGIVNFRRFLRDPGGEIGEGTARLAVDSAVFPIVKTNFNAGMIDIWVENNPVNIRSSFGKPPGRDAGMRYGKVPRGTVGEQV
jgi:hypothetical protein